MTRDLFLAEIKRALEGHERQDELVRFAEASIPAAAGSTEWVLTAPASDADNYAFAWIVECNGREIPDAASVQVTGGLGDIRLHVQILPKNVRVVRT